jgi:hypothetical protein
MHFVLNLVYRGYIHVLTYVIFLNYFLCWLFWFWNLQVGEMDLLCAMNKTKKKIDRQEIKNMLSVFIASLPLIHFCANIPT